MNTDGKNENVIYGLIDPNTKELRYIGYSNNLRRRIIAHYNPSNLKFISHKNNWIKSLLKNNQKPEVIILEKYATPEELPAAEIDMIAYYRYIGSNLTNGTNGGDGTYGRVVSKETRKKISISNTGKKMSAEARYNWKMSNKGKPSSNNGKKASPELRKKLSVAHMGLQGKKRIFSEEQEKMLFEEYNSDPTITIAKLAQQYNVSRDTILRSFKRLKNRQ